MTRTRWAAVLLLAGMMPLVGCRSYPFQAKVDFDETAEARGIRQIVVETQNGAIEVQGDPNQEDVHIQGQKSSRGSTEADARANAERIVIEIERDPNRPEVLRIAAHVPPGSRRRSSGASFTIAVPPVVAVKAKTVNGQIKLAGTEGDADVGTTNGAVRLANVKGTTRVQTSNGKVIAKDVIGDVDIRTSNGAVELVRVGDRRVKAGTSNGRIRAEQLRGNVDLRTGNGSIDLEIASLPDVPEIRAVTSNGGVTVEVPATVKAKLHMRSHDGRVDADLKNVTVADLESSRTQLIATLNGGGGAIELRSTDGSLSFRTSGAGK